MSDARKVETRTTEIRDGIEWFDVIVNGEITEEDQCQCARCGSSADFVDCYNCGGDDEALGSDCIDDMCHGGECIHGDSGFLRCDICRGRGGWWRCISPFELLDAADRMAVARGEAQWTNGYRAAKETFQVGTGTVEHERLYEKEQAQWEIVGRVEGRARRVFMAVLRDARKGSPLRRRRTSAKEGSQ